MNPKGLSHYQSVQAQAKVHESEHQLDAIMRKATLYNVAFLQNKTWLKTLLEMPDQHVSLEKMNDLEKLLLWLEMSQEGAMLSN